jgi:hypothetical protein
MAEFGSQTGWKDDIRIAPGDRQQRCSARKIQ